MGKVLKKTSGEVISGCAPTGHFLQRQRASVATGIWKVTSSDLGGWRFYIDQVLSKQFLTQGRQFHTSSMLFDALPTFSLLPMCPGGTKSRDAQRSRFPVGSAWWSPGTLGISWDDHRYCTWSKPHLARAAGTVGTVGPEARTCADHGKNLRLPRLSQVAQAHALSCQVSAPEKQRSLKLLAPFSHKRRQVSRCFKMFQIQITIDHIVTHSERHDEREAL